jgi:hypothetical protein
LSSLSCSGWSFLLSCSERPGLASLSWLSCPCFPVLAVLCWLSFLGSHVLDVLSWQSCPGLSARLNFTGSLVLAVLFWVSFPICPIQAVLSWVLSRLSCPSCSVSAFCGVPLRKSTGIPLRKNYWKLAEVGGG